MAQSSLTPLKTQLSELIGDIFPDKFVPTLANLSSVAALASILTYVVNYTESQKLVVARFAFVVVLLATLGNLLIRFLRKKHTWLFTACKFISHLWLVPVSIYIAVCVPHRLDAVPTGILDLLQAESQCAINNCKLDTIYTPNASFSVAGNHEINLFNNFKLDSLSENDIPVLKKLGFSYLTGKNFRDHRDETRRRIEGWRDGATVQGIPSIKLLRNDLRKMWEEQEAPGYTYPKHIIQYESTPDRQRSIAIATSIPTARIPELIPVNRYVVFEFESHLAASTIWPWRIAKQSGGLTEAEAERAYASLKEKGQQWETVSSR